MEDFIPEELTDDDDTEELPARDIYKPVPEEDISFPDFELVRESEVIFI